MIAVLASCLPSLTMPAVYAVSSASGEAVARLGGTHSKSGLKLPTPSFSWVNSSALITPACERLQPVLDADVVERRVAARDPVGPVVLPNIAAS